MVPHKHAHLVAYGLPQGHRSGKVGFVAIKRAVDGHRGRWRNEYGSRESRHALDQTAKGYLFLCRSALHVP